MRTKILVIALLLIAFYTPTYSQKQVSTNELPCSALLKKYSAQWKNDSLAGNGFRLSVYKEFLNCQLDSIHVNYLLETLGKPTKIEQVNIGTHIRYNYYDYKHIDTATSKMRAYGFDFLIFTTDLKGLRVTKITKGIGEY